MQRQDLISVTIHKVFCELFTKSSPKIQLKGKDIKSTSHFTYLESVVTSEGGADKDIEGKLGKARGVFVKLKNL